jgi:riboflavin synthase
MFTGLIAEVGTALRLVQKGSEAELSVSCGNIIQEAKPGDSISVDGACVTVERLTRDGFTAFLSRETLQKTTLGDLRPGAAVNLEAALRPTDRLGGHLVQGHVEGIGTVLALERVGEGAMLRVEIPEELTPFVVSKGSIALAGVSLTVAALRGREVEVALIPASLKATTLGGAAAGRRVNVETDVVGRYIVAYLKGLRGERGLSVDELIKQGF